MKFNGFESWALVQGCCFVSCKLFRQWTLVAVIGNMQANYKMV